MSCESWERDNIHIGESGTASWRRRLWVASEGTGECIVTSCLCWGSRCAELRAGWQVQAWARVQLKTCLSILALGVLTEQEGVQGSWNSEASCGLSGQIKGGAVPGATKSPAIRSQPGSETPHPGCLWWGPSCDWEQVQDKPVSDQDIPGQQTGR